MIRKMILMAAAVAMPVGVIAATAGTASAAKVTDANGAPATASCTLSGGSLTFKTPIGIVTAGGYTAPTKNKGNKITIAGVTLTCSSSAVSQGTFTGVASGKITTTNPTESAADFYNCTSLVGVSPGPGGTLSGTLKVKWTTPPNVKFAQKKTAIGVTSIAGGVNMAGDGTFTIPGNPPGSITGGFPGGDAGASSTATDATAQDEGTLATECTSAAGLGTIPLGSGTASLQ